MLSSFWSEPQKRVERKVGFVVQGHGPYSTGADVKICHSSDFNFDAARDEVTKVIWNKLMEKYDFDMPHSARDIAFFYLIDDVTKKKVSQEAVDQTAQDAFDQWVQQKSRAGCAIF